MKLLLLTFLALLAALAECGVAGLLSGRLRAADTQMPKDLETGQPVEWPAQVIRASPPIRVACLGDSITFGAGARSREQEAYPAQLSALLGSGYEVRNFGVGGCTLLFEGDRPYRRQPQFQAAIEFDPDVVLLLLGANDTCGAPRSNWTRSASFTSDARILIQSLRRPRRRVMVALPSPFLPHTPGLQPERTADLEERSPRLEQIRDWWREAAQAEGAEIVDLAGTLAPDPQLTTDGVHPTSAGYARIAARFRDAILGKQASGPLPDAAPLPTRSAVRKVPESAFANALVWEGVAARSTPRSRIDTARTAPRGQNRRVHHRECVDEASPPLCRRKRSRRSVGGSGSNATWALLRFGVIRSFAFTSKPQPAGPTA
jgi:lysophospholipase L1-like esterase